MLLFDTPSCWPSCRSVQYWRSDLAQHQLSPVTLVVVELRLVPRPIRPVWSDFRTVQLLVSSSSVVFGKASLMSSVAWLKTSQCTSVVVEGKFFHVVPFVPPIF